MSRSDRQQTPPPVKQRTSGLGDATPASDRQQTQPPVQQRTSRLGDAIPKSDRQQTPPPVQQRTSGLGDAMPSSDGQQTSPPAKQRAPGPGDALPKNAGAAGSARQELTQPSQASRASSRELPPATPIEPSAQQDRTANRLKKEVESRPESDVLTMLRDSARENLDRIKSHMEAQLEALRSAEASISDAATRVEEDRLVLVREHQAMQEALRAERAQVDKHRTALKEEREDVETRLLELRRREQLGDTASKVDDSQASDMNKPIDQILIKPPADDLQVQQARLDANGSLPDEDEFLRRASNLNPFMDMQQEEDAPEQRKDPSVRIDDAAQSSVRGGAHIVVLGGYNDICLESFGVMAVADDGVVSPFKAEISGMRHPRQLLAAAMIDDRRLIVAGGADANSVTNTTEILELESMTFIRGPRMRARRQGCAMVAIDPYRLIVIGGFDGSTSLPSTEVLSLASMSFVPGPKMNSARWGCAAVKIDDHRILVIGGRVGNWSMQTTEILDCTTMSFSTGPRMSTRRQGCAAVMLRDRRVLVMGGREGASVFFTTEELDLDSMIFKAGPRMRAKRSNCAAVAFDGGRRVLVLGGSDGSSTSLDSTEVLRDGSFETGPDLRAPRSSLAAVLAPAIPPGLNENLDLDMRSELILQCFSLCASEERGLLGESDLRRFARAAGLNKESKDELGKDFKVILIAYHEDVNAVGLTLEHFAELVDNQEDILYCSSHVLSVALQALRMQASRADLVPSA